MRGMTPAADAALQGSNVPYLVLVEFDFADGAVRLTNAAYDFQWNDFTWTGAGGLGSISPIEEGLDLQMYGCSCTLSGIEAGYVAECLGSGYAGRNATIWIAPLDENFQVLQDPIVIFRGQMDTMPLKLGDDASIQITIESKLTSWERPKNRRYNQQDQQSEYPNDMGFEFTAQMVEQKIVWGQLG